MTVGRHGRSIFGLYYWPARDMNLIVLLVGLLLAAAHLVRHIQARRAIRRARLRRYTRLERYPVSDHKTAPRDRGAVYRLSVEFGNWLHLAIFPRWMYAPDSVFDAVWSILYCSLMAFYCWHRTPSIPGDPYVYRSFANMCGIMAYAQTPLVFLLAVKNNPLQPLMGVTYQKLNYLHRASARACILASWVHTVLWVKPLWVNGSMLRFYVVMGYLALGGFTGLWLLSIRIVRRRAYELFLLSHIVLSIAFIIGGCLHWPMKSYWIWPSILIWLLDRAYRLVKRIYCNWYCCPSSLLSQDSTVELVSKDVMRVVIRRKGLQWAAGQHFFITAPSLPGMPHESHPFSISNVPPLPPTSRQDIRERVHEAIFLIRAHGGFTSHLLSALTSASPAPISLAPASPSFAPSRSNAASIPLTLEGPYGHDHPLEHYSTVVLVAGGTGVTFCLSYFMRLLQPFARGEGASRTSESPDVYDAGGRDGEGRGWCGEDEDEWRMAGVPGGGFERGKDDDREHLLPDPTNASSTRATCLRRVKMIWHVRQVEDVSWIAPMLNTALDALGGEDGGRLGVEVSVDVYVTRAIPGQHLSLAPSTYSRRSRPPPVFNTAPIDGRDAFIALRDPSFSRTATHTPIAPLSTAPIGTSQGVTLDQTYTNIYEGTSAEGLADPFRSGRFPMSRIPSSDVCVGGDAADSASANRRSEYEGDPDVGTEERPLLPVFTDGSEERGRGALAGLGAVRSGRRREENEGGRGAMSSSLVSYGSMDSTSSRDRSRSTSTLCSLQHDKCDTSETGRATGTRSSSRPDHASDDAHGLSAASRSYIRLFPGRADLSTIIPSIADGASSSSAMDTDTGADGDEGDMIVVTCGPVPLMHDTRRAVWAANSKRRIKEGRRVVHLLEETVGH